MKEVIIHPGELFDYVETVEVPNPDTSLHIMGGPPHKTPDWVIQGWERAAAEGRAREAAETIDTPPAN